MMSRETHVDASQPRIVTHLPLREGSPDAASLEARRIGDIGAARIAQLLREEPKLWFVVADVGLPFRWIAPSDRFKFWKEEVKRRLVEPDQRSWHREDYPDEYCYRASEWRH